AAAHACHHLRAALRRSRARAARSHPPGARGVSITGGRREILRIAMPWLAMAFFLVVWELACIVFDLPEIILPRPTKVFVVFWQHIDILLMFCWDTLWYTVICFLFAIAGGMLLGVAIGASPLVYSG